MPNSISVSLPGCLLRSKDLQVWKQRNHEFWTTGRKPWHPNKCMLAARLYRAGLLSLPHRDDLRHVFILKKHLQSAWSVIFPWRPHCCLRPGTGDHPNGAQLRLPPESAHIRCWWPRQLRQMGEVCMIERIQSRNHKKHLMVMEYFVVCESQERKVKGVIMGVGFYIFDLVSSFIRVWDAEIELWRWILMNFATSQGDPGSHVVMSSMKNLFQMAKAWKNLRPKFWASLDGIQHVWGSLNREFRGHVLTSCITNRVDSWIYQNLGSSGLDWGGDRGVKVHICIICTANVVLVR